MDELTNEQLASRIRQLEWGSPDYNLLFGQLWGRCEPVVDRVLGGRLGRHPWYWSVQDVEDMKQAVALKAWKSLAQYEGRGDFAAWVGKIAGHAVDDEIRVITGLKRLFSLDWTQAMEEALDRGQVPDALRAQFRAENVSQLRDPEVRKDGQAWIIFADKAAVRSDTGRGRYKVWRLYDRLDVYHWGIPREPLHPCRELPGD